MNTHFMGYPRKNGTYGIRNFFLVIAVDECCEGVVNKIRNEFDDVVVLMNYHTCMLGGNEELYHHMVCGAQNPNVAGVLVVEMGCGSYPVDQMLDEIKKSGKPASSLCCMDENGTRGSIEKGILLVKKLKEECGNCERVPVPVSELIIGVKCGGSDTMSGLVSNPILGEVADNFVKMGATAIGGELLELVGCEEELAKRAKTPEVAVKIERLMKNEEIRWTVDNVGLESMSIGNSVGGLTTIEEKAMGALHKMGTQKIQDILRIDKYIIEKPKEHGFYLSETSMICGGSATDFLALGAHMILWSTAGAGFNCRLIPVIRVSDNKAKISEDIDIDATGILTGEAGIEEVGVKATEYAIAVASGQETKLEWCTESTIAMVQKNQASEVLLHIPCHR